MAPVAGPFYFALVGPNETTFNSSHHRMDWYIFGARRILTEGEKPKLQLLIENPHIGLLSPTLNHWGWFAWDANWGGTPDIRPMFFGRIVGIPGDLQAETLTVTFIAWPSNYNNQLQKVAEGLKEFPFYDPVFIDVAQRDNPATVFDGHSKLIVVDPVTLEVSASDIIDAEDGNVDFTADDHFYNSLHISPGTVPKTAVHVDATVSWTQTAHGFVDLVSPGTTIQSATGDGILSDWPKPGTQIAPGLTAYKSRAIDSGGTGSIEMKTVSGSWQNKEKKHLNGDTMSYSFSLTSPGGKPLFPGAGTIVGVNAAIELHAQYTIGLVDPYAVDDQGDPAPVNLPSAVHVTHAYLYGFTVSPYLTCAYHAARPHTERVVFTLFSNLQPTILDPTVADDSETLNLSGANVGVPIFNPLNWSTIAGTVVTVGTIIFPDNPSVPGGTSAQICTVGGTAGLVEPAFSDVVGTVTIDNTVHWASLGTSSPTENAVDWSGAMHVPTGMIILPSQPFYVPLSQVVPVMVNGALEYQSVSEGEVIGSEADASVCVLSGNYGKDAIMAHIGKLPTGSTYFIATTGGITGAQYIIPPFGSHSTIGNTVTDGSVVWQCIGTGEIPIGGTIGNITSSTYFGTDRGHHSIEYLICRARALLRYSARCVSVQYSCDYLKGLSLSLRKTATLHEPRLPGGIVAGKVVSVEHVAEQGAFTCNVSLASCVGLQQTITEVPGTEGYVDAGYVDAGYFVTTGAVTLVPTLSDVAYSPLVPTPDEDGVTFPLTKADIVISQGMRGATVAAQMGAIKAALLAQNTPTVEQLVGQQFGPSLYSTAIGSGVGNPVQGAVNANQNWYEMILRPLNGNGSFNHVYNVKCTKLEFPNDIDLQSATTT